MSNWNGLDFFIFLIFFLNTILGMSRGASKEIISMMCLSAALIFTIRFTVPIAVWLNSSPLVVDVIQSQFVQNFMRSIGAGPVTEELLGGISYSLSLVICFAGIFSVTEAALNFSGFVEMFTFPWAVWSRQVGAALGCTRGYVITLFFISVLVHTMGSGNNMMSGSWFVRLFQNTVMKLDSLVAGQQVDQYQQLYEDKNLFRPQDIYRIVPPPSPQGDMAAPPSPQQETATSPSAAPSPL